MFVDYYNVKDSIIIIVPLVIDNARVESELNIQRRPQTNPILIVEFVSHNKRLRMLLNGSIKKNSI